MNDKREFDRAIDRWLDDGSDATPPEVIDAVLLAVRSTRQERDFRVPWRTTSMTSDLRVAAVIALVVMASTAAIFTFGPGASGFGAANATPSPSPALLARGAFVIRDWGRVEFEATRAGSSVTGRMEIGMGRGSEWPITVDLQCTRTTDDGLIMIGGYTDGGPPPVGTFSAIALGRAPVRAAIWANGSGPWTQTTDCLANLDGWLTAARTNPTDETWLRDDIGGTVEFGP